MLWVRVDDETWFSLDSVVSVKAVMISDARTNGRPVFKFETARGDFYIDRKEGMTVSELLLNWFPELAGQITSETQGVRIREEPSEARLGVD